MSGDMMKFPKDPKEFVEDYSFVDTEKVYTNGAELIPVFRVHQMLEHYLNNDDGATQKTESTEKLTQLRYQPVLEYVADYLKDRDIFVPVDNNFILSIVSQAILLSNDTHIDTIESELKEMREVMSTQTQALTDITKLIASTIEVMSKI